MFRSRRCLQRTVSLLAIPALLLSPLLVLPADALDPSAFADPAFQRTWERTDKPVEAGAVARTWVWGMPVTGALDEPYLESPGQSRLVQYFDKTRMEISNPDGDQGSIWFVTNGLLVVELMSGMRQAGDSAFNVRGRADVNVAGDPLDPDAVTYADLAPLTTAPPAASGATITQRIDGNGNVTNDPGLAVHGVTAAQRLTVPGIDHQIASVFWNYMNSTGLIWDNGAYTTAGLFPDPYYATGYPLTEPYWTNVDVGGVDTLVLLQCFERRCLTYTPSNAPEWRVEMGNVGLHYHTWRYSTLPEPGDELFVGFLNPTATNEAFAAPRREPNTTPAPGGSVSIIRTTEGDHDYVIAIDAENAGEITGYQIRFSPPYPNPQAVMLDRTFEPGSSTLGELKDVIDMDDISDGLTKGSISPAGFSDMLERGDITIIIRTTQYPNGLDARFGKAAEGVFGARLVPRVQTPAFGSTTFYYSAALNQIDYSTLAFIPPNAAAHLAWDDEDDGPRIIPLIPPVFGAPTGGTITSNDIAPTSVAWLAQQLFTGNASVVVTTPDAPSGLIGGDTFVINPLYQPPLWFFVMNGTSMVPAVDTLGRGTGVVTWNNPDEMDLLVTSADLAGITAVNVYNAPRGQNGELLFSLPVDEGPGEVNGIVDEWKLRLAQFGLSLMRLAFLLESQQTYMTLTTETHPQGAIRGQSQYPAGLEPYGLYLAELTDEALDASITVMLFHSGNQAAYSGEAITWDMYCNGVISWEDAMIVNQLLGLDMAHLVPNDPEDQENGDGFCGSGGITFEDIGPGEPWLGSFEDWPPGGWSPSSNMFLRVLTALGEFSSNGIRQLWVNRYATE